MIRKEKKGLVWFEFQLLQKFPEVVHGCFTRLGGKSLPPFDSLNVSYTVEDNPEHVRANRSLVLDALFSDTLIPLIDVEQVHKNQVIEITSPDQSTKGPYDALITSLRGAPLLIKHADCEPCIIYDPVHHVIANVHAGWRGLVANIFKSTVETLIQNYNSDPKELLACIGPSLSQKASEFISWKEDLPPSFFPYITNNHVDFWKISRLQLEELGLLPDHIEIANLCTFSTPELFFSYRRSSKTGRLATCVGLKK